MVRANGADFASFQTFPELALLGGGSQWRRAFGKGPQLRQVILGQDQIMRTGLAGDGNPLPSSLRNQTDPSAGTDMDDVQSAPGLVCQRQRATNGVEFRFDRPRREIIAHAGSS